jgi:Reverse transcriptase (RNA-dependent DNA polymerase)
MKGDEEGACTCFPWAGGSSMVDMVLGDAGAFEMVRGLDILEEDPGSDHRPVCVSLREVKRDKVQGQNRGKIPVHEDRWDDFKGLFTEESSRKVLESIQQSSTTGDEAATLLGDLLTKNAVRVFGDGSKRRGNFPCNRWYDKDCKDMKRRLRQARAAASDESSSHLMQELRKEYRRICRRKKRTYSRAQTAVLVELAKRQPAKFWRRFKRRTAAIGVRSKEEWEKHCRQLYGKGEAMEGDTAQLNARMAGILARRIDDENSCLNNDFTTEEVGEAVRVLKSRRAADKDGFTVELLRAGITEVIVRALTTIFNKFLSERSFYKDWNEGLLHPIFKKGNPTDCNNYRTVTVISLFGKIFATTIERRISSWAEMNGIRARGQAGFRKKHGAQDHLLTLRVLMEKSKQKGEHLYACFVDFSKAFDSIPREKLWDRLREIGIQGRLLDTIQSMYKEVKCRVVTPEGLTRSFTSHLGVKQGCPLSPLLFGLYIDPLESCMLAAGGEPPTLQDQKVPALMYADDLILLSRGRGGYGLKRYLKKLEEFCNEFGLRVNLEKTKVVVFGPRSERVTTTVECLPFKFGGQVIEVVDKYRYLGIDFHARDNFRAAVNSLRVRGRAASFAMQQRCRELGIWDPKLKSQLFDSLVVTILHYGFEVWGPGLRDTSSNSLEQEHRIFCRGMLGVRKTTLSIAVLGELGRYPLYVSGWKRVATFFNRIVKMENSRLVKLALLESRTQWEAGGRDSWYAQVVEGLHKLSGVTCDDRQPRQIATEDMLDRMKRQYEASWRTITTRKTAQYAQIKQGYKYEEYLSTLHQSPCFRVLTRFRCVSHSLAIEIGSWEDRPVEERVCKQCTRGSVEDEEHFVFHCDKYDQIRENFSALFADSRGDLVRFLNSDRMYLVGQFLLACERERQGR